MHGSKFEWGGYIKHIERDPRGQATFPGGTEKAGKRREKTHGKWGRPEASGLWPRASQVDPRLR